MNDSTNYQEILARLETLQNLLQEVELAFEKNLKEMRSPEKVAILVQVMQAYQDQLRQLQTYGLTISNRSFPNLERCLAMANKRK